MHFPQIESTNLGLDSLLSLLLFKEELESIKVGKSSLLFTANQLLGPSGLFPFSYSILFSKLLGETSGSDSTGNVNLDVGKVSSFEGNDLASNSGGGTFNKNSAVVDNIDNKGNLAGIRSIVDKDSTSNFDKSSENLLRRAKGARRKERKWLVDEVFGRRKFGRESLSEDEDEGSFSDFELTIIYKVQCKFTVLWIGFQVCRASGLCGSGVCATLWMDGPSLSSSHSSKPFVIYTHLQKFWLSTHPNFLSRGLAVEVGHNAAERRWPELNNMGNETVFE